MTTTTGAAPMSAAEVMASLKAAGLELKQRGCPELGLRLFAETRAAVSAMAEREAALVAERDSLRKRSREMCQALVNAVGADGPCNAEDAAAKLVSERDALVKEVEALREEVKALTPDRDRLNAVVDGSWGLRCFEIPTPGGDDADIGWRVIEHHIAAPHERVVAEVFYDSPRAAIDAARTGNDLP